MGNPFAAMRRLHERGPTSRGVAVDREGVVLGPDCVVVQLVRGSYRCIPTDQVATIARAISAGHARLERLPLVLGAIANALNAGDLVKAQLLGLDIPIAPLDDDQLARLAALADLIKAGFDPNQPRDEHGRWTETGGTEISDAGFSVEIADASEGLSDAGGVLPVADTPSENSGNAKPINMSEITDPRKKPVKVLDDYGQAVLDQNGDPMWRPKDLPPSLFVDKGLAAAAALRNAPVDASLLAQDPFVVDYLQFRQGEPLDAQRVKGIVVRQYIDYATVAIGLYGAAAKIPLDDMLAAENEYAGWHPRQSGEEMDDTYQFLPKRNVANTKLGYTLYNSRRIGPSAAP